MTHEYWFQRGNLAGLAVELRMHASGQADYFSAETLASLAAYLRARITTWSWRNPTTPFDGAVQQIVRGALVAYDESRVKG